MPKSTGSSTSYAELKLPPEATSDLVNQQSDIDDQNERLNVFNYRQVSFFVVILAIAIYAMLEPFLPEGYSSLKLFAFIGKNPTRPPSIVKQIVYVLQSACLPLLMVLLTDMLKEYRHAMYDAIHYSEDEIVLSEQMKTASQAKLAERVHIRTLSQLVVLVLCQLALVVDSSLPSSLTRVVPITNALYLTSRAIDLVPTRRFRLLTNMITNLPLLVCIIFIFSCQIYHNFLSSTTTK